MNNLDPDDLTPPTLTATKMEWTNNNNQHHATDDDRPPRDRYYSVDTFLFGALARIGEAYNYSNCPTIFFDLRASEILRVFDSPDGLALKGNEKIITQLSSFTFSRYCLAAVDKAAGEHGDESAELKHAVLTLDDLTWDAIKKSAHGGKARMQLDKFSQQPTLIMLVDGNSHLAHDVVTDKRVAIAGEPVDNSSLINCQCAYCVFKASKLKKSSFNPANISRLIDTIEHGDFDEIDSARDIIRPAQLAPLVAHYWTLTDWDKKRSVVEMMMDQYSDEMNAMMLDFLRAPDDTVGDQTEMAKAVAIGFSGDEYNISSIYYNDRERLKRDVNTVLKANGLEIDSSAQMGTLESPVELTASTAIQSHATEQPHQDDTDEIHKRGIGGATLLQLAAADGQLGEMRRLLDLGADINATNYQGATPIFSAARDGQLEAVKLLFQRGADIHLGLRNLINEVPDGRKPIHLAATNNHIDVVAYLITVAGNNINERSPNGYTLLMSAAWQNHCELAEQVLKLGSDVNAIFEDPKNPAAKGFTPLVFSVNNGYARMTQLLVDAGADVNYKVPATPPRYVHEFNKGKQAKEIDTILRAAGAKI